MEKISRDVNMDCRLAREFLAERISWKLGFAQKFRASSLMGTKGSPRFQQLTNGLYNHFVQS
jgi:hypothetical protein